MRCVAGFQAADGREEDWRARVGLTHWPAPSRSTAWRALACAPF